MIEGEPIYKVSNDDNWYVLCWVDKETAESYSEGRAVSLELPEGTVDASVHSVREGRRRLQSDILPRRVL